MTTVDEAVLGLMVDAEARLRIADPSGVESLLDVVSRRAAGDRRLHARVASARATLEYLRSRFDRAFEASLHAVDSWKSLGDLGEAASARAVGARVLLSVRSVEEAFSEAVLAGEDATRDGDARALMNTTTALGHVYFAMQRFDQALARFEGALRIARTLEDRVAEGAMLDAVACVYGCQASTLPSGADESEKKALLSKALDLWGQAMSIARETGHRRNLAAALANEAEALVLFGLPEHALMLLQCWTIDPAELPRVIWHLRDTEGVVLIRLGRPAEAIVKLNEALRHADSGVQKMNAHGHLSEAYELTGDAVSALSHHKSFHTYYKQVASEAAQRSASVAAVRLATNEASALAIAAHERAEQLAVSYDRLSQRAEQLMHLSLAGPLVDPGNRRLM